jgi:hypothetical protein
MSELAASIYGLVPRGLGKHRRTRAERVARIALPARALLDRGMELAPVSEVKDSPGSRPPHTCGERPEFVLLMKY